MSLGGYLGSKNIKLNLTNNTAKEITVDIDPALIFVPEDTLYQDLVLLGNETIVLAPSAQQDVSLQAFCGKSYARGPRSGLRYSFKKQGDTNMVKTLTYIKENNIDVHLAQCAVWTFTNGHCLSTVYSHDKIRMSEDLIKYIASIRKLRVPEYYMEYQLDNTAGRPVLAYGKEKVYVTMHWGIDDGYRHMHLTIYKENGEIYKTIGADQVIDKYGYTVTVRFDPKVDPKGLYSVTLHDDAGKVWDKKKVIIGANACDLF